MRSLVGAFIVRMCFLLKTMTPLVLVIEVMCRVMTIPATLASECSFLWTWVLAVTLMVSAELLSMSMCGWCMSVWVTYRCRCRLFEMPLFFRLRLLLRLLTWLRNLLMVVMW